MCVCVYVYIIPKRNVKEKKAEKTKGRNSFISNLKVLSHLSILNGIHRTVNLRLIMSMMFYIMRMKSSCKV